ncbi:serine hydrolase domain-containing protein [Acanthopleuribacter pedis]|uniref:Beta-lactamase family protein n=1 Tax=Acanthopleuribacter pedis TaxID=442870 RepID=A0A8J7QJP7_9BACT|nr:serine hydrolase domain-containing protein [Acanthopleuribacter pedis]MBO1319450.1 beta-lactamase family protein [Acanthopleuribacter pedis]
MTFTSITLLLLFYAGGDATPKPPETFAPAWEQFQQMHSGAAEREGIIGSSAMFLQNGRIIATHFRGYANQAKKVPVTEDTIFHWGSCTKTLTGIAIMQLRDRKLLTLDDPIVTYLPELRQVHNPFGEMEAITLRHLMTHTAGFRRGTWPWQTKDWQTQPTRWSQIVAMLPYSEIHFEPGSKFGYSNPAIIFLGMVIEQLSGDDYEVYIDKNILKPLGMHRSFFDNTPYHLEADRAHAYYRINDELEDKGGDFDSGITVANGGLNAPLTDMARYLAFLIGDPNNPAYAGVLQRSSLEEMWRPHIFAREKEGAREDMGLIFYTSTRGEHPYLGHAGSQFGYTSFMFFDPQTKTGSLAAFNTSVYTLKDKKYTAHPEKTLYKVRNHFFDHLFPLFRNKPKP